MNALPQFLAPLWRRARRLMGPTLAATPGLIAAGVLVACGGGGASAPTTTTQSAPTVYASGPITGFGSVIINGVRFDDSAAAITDDDGQAMTEAQLHLGMQADVDGAADTSDHSRGTAHAIEVHSALVGPVSAVDPAAGTVTVLGQTVTINAQTAFDTAITGGLAGVALGNVLQVYGQFDTASQSYVATRIDLDAAATRYKIRGTVTVLDATARTLQVGATPIDFSTTPNVPTTLAVGSVVVARLDTTPNAGVWTALAIRDGHRATGDHDEAHLRGVISDFTSATQFSVDGTPVDATNATFPNGQAALALGATVEVEGQLANGVLVARSVGIEDDHAADAQRVELHGKLSALDTTAMTFTLRGVTVSYAGTVTFKDGTAATLANDLFIEVKGGLAADGTTVAATVIELAPKD